MARVLFLLAALVAANGFATDCLNDYLAGRLNRAQYDQCVSARTSASTSSATPIVCHAVDACGRRCTDREFGRSCNGGGSLFGSGQGQWQLSSQQLFQLMLAYYAGFLSKDQLAQYLFYANPWQYYLLSYYYGDKAVDVVLQQYQIPFYQQLFGSSGASNWNPWLFASFLGRSGT